jgi:hypothetical protein
MSRSYNLTVGEALTLPVKSAEKPVTILTPAGTSYRLQPQVKTDGDAELPYVEFEETDMAGIYTVLSDEDADSDDDNADESRFSGRVAFAVNPDPIESDLTTLDDKVVQGMLKSVDINLITYSGNFAADIRESRHGKEIWRYLILTVLVLLVVEVTLAYMIDKT